jgi:tetratricopeptide (TPR) repeat protein
MKVERIGILLPVFLAGFALFFACVAANAGEQQDAESLVEKGRDLFSHAQYDEAIAVFEEMDKRFGKSNDAKVRERVATALGLKGRALEEKGYRGKAIEAWEEADRRYGKDHDPAMRVTLSQLLYNKLRTLVDLSIHASPKDQEAEFEAALATFNEFERRYGKDNDPTIRRMGAQSFFQKACALGNRRNDHQGSSDGTTYRTKEAVAVLDEMIRRYGEDKEPAIRMLVARAFLEEGEIFFQTLRREEEIAIYDELDRRFGKDEAPDIRVIVIEGLSQKAWRLVQEGNQGYGQDKYKLAVSLMDEIVERFGKDRNEEVQGQIIKVLLSKAKALGSWGHFGGENARDKRLDKEIIAVYDKIDQLYGNEKASAIRAQVAEALCHKGSILAENQPKAALSTLEALDRRYAKDEEPAVLDWVARGLIEKGIILMKQNRLKDAHAAFSLVVQRYKEQEGMSDPVSLAEFYLYGD